MKLLAVLGRFLAHENWCLGASRGVRGLGEPLGDIENFQTDYAILAIEIHNDTGGQLAPTR